MARISATPVPMLALAYRLAPDLVPGHARFSAPRSSQFWAVTEGRLLDRKNCVFGAVQRPASARTVYNPSRFIWGTVWKELPVELPLLYFTIETARAGGCWRLVRRACPFDGPFTLGPVL